MSIMELCMNVCLLENPVAYAVVLPHIYPLIMKCFVRHNFENIAPHHILYHVLKFTSRCPNLKHKEYMWNQMWNSCTN